MCVSEAGATAFHEALHSTTGFDVKTLIGSVDAANANATVRSDKLMILGEIDGSIGVAAFDSKVQGFMESALKELASSLALRATFSTKRQTKQTELVQHLGRVESAISACASRIDEVDTKINEHGVKLRELTRDK